MVLENHLFPCKLREFCQEALIKLVSLEVSDPECDDTINSVPVTDT